MYIHSQARIIESQNIVRASTADRFTCFSWSKGLKSYTGYIAPHLSPLNPHLSNLVVPFKANNTGNLLGWYEVQGRRTNAEPVADGVYELQGDGWVMNGELLCNGRSLDHRFAIYSTPGNAVVYHDLVTVLADTVVVNKEKGGLLAISMDEMTRQQRTFYFDDGDSLSVDGKKLQTFHTPYLNIDQTFGVVADCQTAMAFGDMKNNNSVTTALLYTSYNDRPCEYLKGQTVGRRSLAYYSNVSAAQTRELAAHCLSLPIDEGWRATLVADTDGSHYLLVSNFSGQRQVRLDTTLLGRQLTLDISLEQNHSATYKVELKKRKVRVFPIRN